MTVTPSSPIVGIFRDRSMAEQAIDALHAAGFASEQVRYSPPGTSGSILTDLKNMFTGQNASSGNISRDLTDMGLSDEEAQYYSNEHNNGNTILAISASGREQEALNILHQYGAYNARTSESSPETASSQTPVDSTEPATYTPDPQSPVDSTEPATYTPDPTQQTAYTFGETSSQQERPAWATQEQPSDVENHPFHDAEQDIVTSTPDTETQSYQSNEDPTAQDTQRQPTEPLVPVSRSTPQSTSSDATTLEASPDSQVTPSDSAPSDSTFASQATPSEVTDTDATPEYQAAVADTTVTGSSDELHDAQVDAAPSDVAVTDFAVEPQAAQTDMAPSSQTVTDSPPEPQATQTDVAPSDAAVTDSTPASQNTPVATAPAEYEDELQQIQAQLQAAQQQLQDARAQLQAAKDHEAQVQIIRERERQLKDARQQLQDIQAQLQATLAELDETRQRISQHQ